MDPAKKTDIHKTSRIFKGSAITCFSHCDMSSNTAPKLTDNNILIILLPAVIFVQPSFYRIKAVFNTLKILQR